MYSVHVYIFVNACTEVGYPWEGTRQIVCERLNDVWVRGLRPILLTKSGISQIRFVQLLPIQFV
jgi:hypothetical protein